MLVRLWRIALLLQPLLLVLLLLVSECHGFPVRSTPLRTTVIRPGSSLGMGQPQQSPRSRSSGSARTGNTNKNKNKSRKTDRSRNARAKQEKGMNRKLQADADFFWDCVRKKNRGEDIAGASGKKWHRPSEQELFGESTTTTSSRSDTTPTQGVVPKVTRTGANDVLPMEDNFDFLSQLPSVVLDNLLGHHRMRYTAPTPIQRHCVPLALAGYDVLASAQTGSGKTVGFLLPLIASVAANRRRTSTSRDSQEGDDTPPTTTTIATKSTHPTNMTPSSPAALILAPTRELALQIELEIEKLTFGAPLPPCTNNTKMATRWSACCYGGATARPQLEALASGVEILVATPGRLADFLDRDLVSLAKCHFLVLDEADRMLDMGFEPQLRKIVEQKDMPRRTDRQTLLFSATFPAPLRAIAQTSYLRTNFAQVAVGKVGASNQAVEQRLLRVQGAGTKRDKLEALLLLLLNESESVPEIQAEPGPTIVFTNKKHVARWITKELTKHSIKCSQIHGDRTQGQREAALAQFRDGSVDVLVATDAVSRGIDVPDVAHVIQFDLPVAVKEFESYTHRIGRTGRAGKTGIATAFYVPGNEPKVGNGELWPLLKASFDESGMELPDWFYKEQNGQQQQQQQQQSCRNKAPRQRQPKSVRRKVAAEREREGSDAAAIAMPPPIRSATRGTGTNAGAAARASGLKKKPRLHQGVRRARGSITKDDEAKLNVWLENLGPPPPTKNIRRKGN